jgi:hypothetical protein
LRLPSSLSEECRPPVYQLHQQTILGLVFIALNQDVL